MNQVCAVVVTYNRLEMLKRCIAALKAQTSPCDILVIDNASTDGTGDYLAGNEDIGFDKSINYCCLDKNSGGAGGFNKGMREAVERGYDYIWLMDDDVIPYPDALEKLLESDNILSGRYGWLSSVPLWTDGKGCRMNKQKIDSAFYDNIDHLQQGLLRSNYATFVSLFMRRETIIKAGLPIKEFFIWGDDIEFTRRISVRMKIPCYIAGQSLVIHAMKENNGSNIATDEMSRLNRYNYAFRNENYLYRKEGIKGFMFYFAKCGQNLMLSLFKAKDHRLKRAWIVLKQFFVGMSFNPEVEYLDK